MNAAGQLEGRIADVADERSGTELVTATLVGEDVLEVLDVEDDLDLEGGQLQIGEEVRTYTVDEETLEVTLDAPLEQAYDAEEPVYVYPLEVERWAYVQAADQAEELEARVPHSMIDRIPEGIRDPDAGEVVIVALEDDDYVVVDVLGELPVIDPEYVEVAGLPNANVPLLDDFNRPDEDPVTGWDSTAGAAIVDEALVNASGSGARWPTSFALPAALAFTFPGPLEVSADAAGGHYVGLNDAETLLGGAEVGIEPGSWWGEAGVIWDLYAGDSPTYTGYGADQLVRSDPAGCQVALHIEADGETASLWLRRPRERWVKLTEQVLPDPITKGRVSPVLWLGGPFDDFRAGRGRFVDGTWREEATDGLPPAASPAVTLEGGPGYLAASWSAVANTDPVTYEVHLGTSSGFTPDDSTLVGEIRGTSWIVTTEADGSPLEYATTYYVRVVARDVDGEAAAGAEDSATLTLIEVPQIEPIDFSDLAGQIDPDTQIAAASILGDRIIANSITANELAANSVTVLELAAGSVEAGKIAAGAIETDKLAAGAVTAAKIGAAAVEAGKIAADAIDAMTITGATFRTSATDPKVQMDSTGLFATDASGNKDLHLTTSGLELLAGTTGTPPTTRRVRWLREADDDLVAEVAAYREEAGAVEGDRAIVIKTLHDTSEFVSASAWLMAHSDTYLRVRRTDRAANVSFIEATADGQSRQVIRDTGGSDFLQLEGAGGSGGTRIKVGKVSLSFAGGVAASSTFAHGLTSPTVDAAMACADRGSNANAGKVTPTFDDNPSAGNWQVGGRDDTGAGIAGSVDVWYLVIYH